MAPLISRPIYGFSFCMAGRVRSKQACPRCGGKFKGEPLGCPSCLTIPTRYFLDVPWKGERLKIYTGKDGHPLAHWEGAQRLLEAIRHEIDTGRFDPREYQTRELKSLRFDNYAQEWLRRRQKELERGHISLSYFQECQSYVHRYFVPFFERRSIRDLREAHVEDFRDQLPEHLSAKTVFNILGILRKLFRDAYRRKDILVLPEFPKIPKGEPVTQWISEEDQELVLAQMKDPVRRAFYFFLIKQGCRPAEARALKWDQIDFKSGLVTIAASFTRDVFKSYTKERDVRYLPLHPQVREVLQALPRSILGWVFTYQGKPLSQWLASNYWRRCAKKAGINVNCYEGTRHSLASQAINRGVSERKVGDFLGHKTNVSTRRYAKMRTEALKEVWGPSSGDRPWTVPKRLGTKNKLLNFKDKK